MFSKRWIAALAILVTALTLAACGGGVQTVIVTEIVEGEVVETIITVLPEGVAPEGPLEATEMIACLPLPEGVMPAAEEEASTRSVGAAAPAVNYGEWVPNVSEAQADNIYRVGIFEDITTTNYWGANGPDNTVWNSYVLPERLSLYTLSDQSFTFIPNIALDLPAELAEDADGNWYVDVPIRDDIVWSDGEPFTAEDVAFTANTALRFGLISGNWVSWYDPDYLDHIEALDDYTARIIYHTKPGLARHQYGTLQAPILAEHFWAPLADEAAAPIDALGEAPSEEDLVAAQAEATDNLFAIDATGEPLAGGFLLQTWEPGAFIETPTNPGYFATGTTITKYVNGAYVETVGGAEAMVIGTPEGDVAYEVEIGPHVTGTIYSVYGSQDAALLALRDGEIDFLLHPLGLQRGLQEQVEADPELQLLANPTNGFRYLSFNVRRQPMNDCSFRQAVALLIDKEYVTGTILQGVAFPLYTFVPEANAAWYFGDVPMLGASMSREDRVNYAVQILQTAGYSWEDDVLPTWDAEGGFVSAGGRLILPDGTLCPDLDLWGPSAGYDPLRATFAVWIETWLNEAGIPVTAHLAGFNVLVPRIFTDQDFDMYILGWSLSLFPSFLRDFWHSSQAVTDGNNAGGYNNPEFDALSDQLLACETVETCKALADEIQIMLSTEVPYIVLFDTGITEPYRPAAVEYPFLEHLSGMQYIHQGPGQSLQTYVRVR